MAKLQKKPSRFKKFLNQKFSLFTFTLSILTVLLVGFVAGTRYDDYFVSSNSLKPLKETYKALQANFDGELDDKKLIEGASRGMVESVGDPYTVYFDKKEALEFNKSLDGTFSGIGAELGKKDGKLVVIAPLDSSPAKKAGLKPNDIVAKVDDIESLDWPIDKAVAKIRGEKGTKVKLTVIRDGDILEFTITRDVITDPSVKTEEKGNTGVIRISRFSKDTAGLVRKAAKEFQGKNAIVVDLRGNGGGYLQSAQEIASLWLAEGQIVVTERSGGEIVQTHRAEDDGRLKGKKTIVLIDQGSASASEILAGALQDYGAATIVGEKSFGKGSVQDILSLPNGAKLKVTIAKWYTPSGKNIGKHGITPDVQVSLLKTDDSTHDTQLLKALDLAN